MNNSDLGSHNDHGDWEFLSHMSEILDALRTSWYLRHVKMKLFKKNVSYMYNKQLSVLLKFNNKLFDVFSSCKAVFLKSNNISVLPTSI